MTVETEKPFIREDGDVYLLGRQKIWKSEGAGKTLTLLLSREGWWFDLRNISENTGWNNPDEEMLELQHRVCYNTSYRIEKRGREGKKEYRIITKN